MKFLASALSVLVAAVSAVQAVSVSGPRLLAVLDDLADKDTYSTFFGDLEGPSRTPCTFQCVLFSCSRLLTPYLGRGFAVSCETAKSSTVSLFHLGERAYDHVIFFPTKAKGAIQ